jgi:hypothetical protein
MLSLSSMPCIGFGLKRTKTTADFCGTITGGTDGRSRGLYPDLIPGDEVVPL